MGGQSQNQSEVEILIKITEIELREIGLASKEIYNLSHEEVEQYLTIINAKKEMERKELERIS